MDDLFKTIGAGLAFSAGIIVLAPLVVLFGAFAGWTVELFWGDAILRTLRAVGLPPDITMWNLGAALGFVGAFLRTKIEKTKY